MGLFDTGNAPGFTRAIESEEAQVWWKGRGPNTMLTDQKINLASVNTDAGNTPTTTIRGGHVLAKETVSGNHYLYDADANDGRQFSTGILEKHTNMLVDNVATQRFMLQMSSGLYKLGELFVTGGTKGDVDLQAQAQLVRQGWLPDGNGPDGEAFLEHPMGIERISATTKTLVAADNGKLFLQLSGAGNFTLPAASAANVGFAVQVLQTTDNNLVITSAAGNDIIYKHDAAASTLTMSTGSQKLGSKVELLLIYTAASTIKWTVNNLGDTTIVPA